MAASVVLPAPPRKLLIVQLRRIGDAILVAPALDAIGEAWPGTRIHLLAEAPVPDLFRGDPRISVVWPWPRSGRFALAGRLRRERFDLVLDFQSLPATALLARFLGRPSIGFGRRRRGFLYTAAVDLAAHAGSDYAADHKLDLLRAAGLHPRLAPPHLRIGEAPHPAWNIDPSGPRVVLVPVSRRPHKRWTPAAFAETVARMRAEMPVRPVVAAGPGEDGAVEEMLRALGPDGGRGMICRTLAEFASLLRHADLYLGNDSGPRHLAVAVGTPTVAWFGAQNPANWTPPGAPEHVALWDRARAAGRPVRGDLILVPDRPADAARAALRLLAARRGEATPAGPGGGGATPSGG